MTTAVVHVDTVPLRLQPLAFDGAKPFNPSLGPLPIDLKASKAAHLTLAILPEKSNQPVKTFDLGHGAAAKVQWDGKDNQGQLVPPGNYQIRAQAQDETGRTTEITSKVMLPVTDKRIVVSLSQERLVAYAGNNVVVSTLVTTGGPELPTPIGAYRILAKDSPFTFHSPWPKGSPFWYADSPVSYALLFQDQGYFIHDAPWEPDSAFGPGSENGYYASHGCVHIESTVMPWLYSWAGIGTTVVITG